MIQVMGLANWLESFFMFFFLIDILLANFILQHKVD